MAAVDEGRMVLVGQLYAPLLIKRNFVDLERRTLWIIHEYKSESFANSDVQILNVDRLRGDAQGIIRRWREDRMRFDVFCWYESETRPFNLEFVRNLAPCFILGRRALNPRNEQDYFIALEAFGRPMSRRDIEAVMTRTEEDRLSLARMLVMRANQGWIYCNMLFTRLWNSDLDVFFLEYEFLRSTEKENFRGG